MSQCVVPCICCHTNTPCWTAVGCWRINMDQRHTHHRIASYRAWCSATVVRYLDDSSVQSYFYVSWQQAHMLAKRRLDIRPTSALAITLLNVATTRSSAHTCTRCLFEVVKSPVDRRWGDMADIALRTQPLNSKRGRKKAPPIVLDGVTDAVEHARLSRCACVCAVWTIRRLGGHLQENTSTLAGSPKTAKLPRIAAVVARCGYTWSFDSYACNQ